MPIASAGGPRLLSLPSTAADALGTIYVVWEDCRFRSNCASNELIMSASMDGAHSNTPVRIPIDADSSADHFIPGLDIDPGTSATGAHLGLTHANLLPRAACSWSSCALYVSFISSVDGQLPRRLLWAGCHPPIPG